MAYIWMYVCICLLLLLFLNLLQYEKSNFAPQKEKIKLHNSDIKDIYFDTKTLITIGRDSKLRIITTDKNITKEINQGYLNSLAVKLPHIFIGTQSGNLCVYNLETDNLFNIKIHENNICTMKIKDNLLITGSWDNSVKAINLLKLIQKKEEVIFYEKYKCTVLSVNFYKTGFITGLENGIINFYKKKEESFEKINEFYLHNHPIRDLFVKNDLIKSVSVSLIESNEKKVKNFIDFDNFMFGCTEKMVVGDTGLIVYEGKSYQIPVGTIWKVVEVNNTYLLACSDGYVYIFNQPISLNFQNEEDFQVYEYIKNQEEFQNEELSEDYKIEDGIIYQKVGDNFIKLGKIKYDSLFTIEIENRNINVEFNKNESPTDIATRIIKEKKINPIYKEEISDFIKKNFKKEESYKYFTGLPKEKVIPLLQTKPNLKKLICEEKTDLEKVQEELNDLFNESKFLFLDLLRYFYSKNLKFKINFLFDYQPDFKNSKECLAYVRLITNLFGKVNLNLEMFRRIMMDILDSGLVDKGKFYEYEFNRQVILKK